MRTAFLIVAILLGFIGFESRPAASQPATAPAGNLTFRDTAGATVATANIVLPEKLPAIGKTFKGSN